MQRTVDEGCEGWGGGMTVAANENEIGGEKIGSRVDSFIFFLVSRNTKLNEQVTVSPSFDCFAIYEIKCLELFRETKKTFRFVISHIFTEILYLFFEFCTFDSSTFYSILVPFT